jgi:hypothetical protein
MEQAGSVAARAPLVARVKTDRRETAGARGGMRVGDIGILASS